MLQRAALAVVYKAPRGKIAGVGSIDLKLSTVGGTRTVAGRSLKVLAMISVLALIACMTVSGALHRDVCFKASATLRAISAYSDVPPLRPTPTLRPLEYRHAILTAGSY